MSFRSVCRRFGLLLALLVLAACQAPGGSVSTQEAQLRTIAGTVRYLEDVSLPAGAEITVTLEAVPVAGVVTVPLAQKRFIVSGNPPYSFALSYDTAGIHPHRAYGLGATISYQDRLLFSSKGIVPVLAQAPVDILVVRVRAPRPRPQR